MGTDAALWGHSTPWPATPPGLPATGIKPSRQTAHGQGLGKAARPILSKDKWRGWGPPVPQWATRSVPPSGDRGRLADVARILTYKG